MSNKLIVLTDEAFNELSSKLDALLENTQNKEQQSKSWLTNVEVMELLDISKSTLQSYRDKMLIPYYQIGRKILYKPADIAAYMEQFKITLKTKRYEKAKV